MPAWILSAVLVHRSPLDGVLCTGSMVKRCNCDSSLLPSSPRTERHLLGSLKRHERINDEIIRVHSAIIDISDFEALLAQLRQGVLHWGDEVIHLGRAIDLAGQSTSIQTHGSHSTEPGSPVFERPAATICPAISNSYTARTA